MLKMHSKKIEVNTKKSGSEPCGYKKKLKKDE
jgi:hypothetical protein